jgi:hypothetical protein
VKNAEVRSQKPERRHGARPLITFAFLLLTSYFAMISLTSPQPLAQAVAHLSAKTPVGSLLKSADWLYYVPAELREAAFFTSTVESGRVIDLMQSKLNGSIGMMREQVANGTAMVDRSSFIGDLKKFLTDMGYAPEPGAEGGLADLGSAKRLGLIFDMNIQSAQGFAAMKFGQDPDMLDNFPAQELIRFEARKIPRDWIARWRDSGGRFYNRKMVALKSDEIWTRISRFGRPWPPFDFNSGMGVEDVTREEATAMGLVQPGEKIAPSKAAARFTDGMRASIAGMTPRTINSLLHIFGDRVTLGDGFIEWNKKEGAQ